MMPHEPVRTIMRRTMANLEYVERNAKASGPFEVTQLINSFIGALAHPWEKIKPQLKRMPLSCAKGWPVIKKECASDREPGVLGDLIRLLRNGIAHGHIEFLPGPQDEIEALRIWNKDRHGRRTWGTRLTVDELRVILDQFVELADELGNLDE